MTTVKVNNFDHEFAIIELVGRPEAIVFFVYDHPNRQDFPERTEKGIAQMRIVLIALFAFIFVFMVVMTARTQMQVSFWNFSAWQPAYAANPWAVATLYDAYFGFITFFVWVCFKERSLLMKILWFILIMGLGNIAMSFYVLLQLFKLKPSEPVANVLLRRTS